MNCVLATLLSVWGMPGHLSSPRPCARALVALVDVSGSMGIDDKGQTRLSRAVSLIRDLARDNPPCAGSADHFGHLPQPGPGSRAHRTSHP